MFELKELCLMEIEAIRKAKAHLVSFTLGYMNLAFGVRHRPMSYFDDFFWQSDGRKIKAEDPFRIEDFFAHHSAGICDLQLMRQSP